jgi:hypothetical protein
MLAQRGLDSNPKHSITAMAAAKRVDLGSEEYVSRVATPIMNAVDGMPPAYRALVSEFGYVDVYRVWLAAGADQAGGRAQRRAVRSLRMSRLGTSEPNGLQSRRMRCEGANSFPAHHSTR